MLVRSLQRCVAAIAVLLLISPAAARADVKAALAKYAAAMAAVHSYHADIQTDRGTIGMDVQNPGRYHMTMPGAHVETVAIGEDFWVKTGGNWMHIPVHMPNMDQMIERARAANPPSKIDEQYRVDDLGLKDGLHLYKLQRKGEQSEVTIALRSDSLPAKMVSVSGGKTTTITYSNFNAVTVTAPQ